MSKTRIPKVTRATRKEEPKSTDRERLNWIAGMVAEYKMKIEEGIIPGCMCGGCHGYILSWKDENEHEIRVGHDFLKDAIDEGIKLVPDPWGF